MTILRSPPCGAAAGLGACGASRGTSATFVSRGASFAAACGAAFARFMVLPATQQVIGDFGKDKYNQALFFPDAGKPEPVPGG